MILRNCSATLLKMRRLQEERLHQINGLWPSCTFIIHAYIHIDIFNFLTHTRVRKRKSNTNFYSLCTRRHTYRALLWLIKPCGIAELYKDIIRKLNPFASFLLILIGPNSSSLELYMKTHTRTHTEIHTLKINRKSLSWPLARTVLLLIACMGHVAVQLV